METISDVLHSLVAAVFTGELADLAGPAHEAIDRGFAPPVADPTVPDPAEGGV
jgi:hypothetical protein